MTTDNNNRIDEVAEHYDLAKIADAVYKWLFWIIAAVIISMPFTTTLFPRIKESVSLISIIGITIYFCLSILLKLYLIPKAELIRRKQMLSDSYGVNLTHEHTAEYYNNGYASGIKRLGASTMESAFFSKEVSAYMLLKVRIVTAVYIVCWIIALYFGHKNLELLTGTTQTLFSGEVAFQWLSFEFLRFRYKEVYDRLYAHFYQLPSDDSAKSTATIIDAFGAYEAAKASAGILLSTKVFKKLNSELNDKWERVSKNLKMADNT